MHLVSNVQHFVLLEAQYELIRNMEHYDGVSWIFRIVNRHTQCTVSGVFCTLVVFSFC